MNALPLVLFGLLCAGIGSCLTAFPYWRVLDRERSERLNADRLRATLRSQTWTEARW